MAYSVHPVYHDHVSRIWNQSTVNPHATPHPILLSKFSVMWSHLSHSALFLIILLRPHQSMKRLAPHQAHAVPWPPEALSSQPSTIQLSPIISGPFQGPTPAQAFSYDPSHLILEGTQPASLHTLLYHRNIWLHIWLVLASPLMAKTATSLCVSPSTHHVVSSIL